MPVQDLKGELAEPLLWSCRGYTHFHHHIQPSRLRVLVYAVSDKISVDTVDNYLTLMCNAFLLYQCERYNLRGKERLRTNGKYYVTDLGLRNHLLGYRRSDLGHAVENIVFFELKRRGYEVTTGKYDDLEIDFVGTKKDEKIYVQVSLTAIDENTLQREIKPFSLLDDKYPKILITTDEFDLSNEFFDHVNLYDFLLQLSE